MKINNTYIPIILPKSVKSKGYEYLKHTADLKFKAWGETLEEAFSNAAFAMVDFMIKTEKVEPKIERKINIEAENLEALLYLWLEAFLINLDAEFFIPHEVKEIKINESNGRYQLRATVVGDENRGQYEFSGGVKAATYNDMEIKKKEGVWELTAVVDI
ncbi:MAG: archease [Candidatus Hydrothermarchaeales archaeon]